MEGKSENKKGRHLGRGFGLSGMSEEGNYLHPPQAWLGPIPTCPRRQNTKKLEKYWRRREMKMTRAEVWRGGRGK